MWSWIRNSRTRPQRRTAQLRTDASGEQLEQRTLLAGNVRLVTSANSVRLIGDQQDNTVKIFQNSGGIWAEGLNETTINDSGDAVLISSGDSALQASFRADLGNGNDTLVISPGTSFDRSVRFSGGQGDDQFFAVGASFAANVVFRGHRGDDEFSAVESSFGQHLSVLTSTGDDVVSLTDTSLTGSTIIRTSLQDDGISFHGVTSDGRILVDAGYDTDSFQVTDSFLLNNLVFIGRRGQDAVRLQSSIFDSTVTLRGGRENDAFEILGENTFHGILRLNGGKHRPDFTGDISGTDQYQLDTASTLNGPLRVTRTESDELAPGIAARFDDDEDGLTALAAALDQDARDLAVSVIELTAVGSAVNSLTDSGGVIVTRDNTVNISGTTVPGAEVSFDSDADGLFDDATVIADGQGHYSVDVTLTRTDLYTDVAGDDGLTGRQSIAVRALSGPDEGLAAVEVDYVTGTVVEFTSSQGTWHLELFDDVAPNVTQNFLNYVDPEIGETTGRYTNSIIHRSVDNFVIQGGGFTVNNGVIDSMSLDASVTSEFSPERGNIKGTISMAHAGDPDVLTSQWFVNTIDNPALDDFAGRRHTVFGRLVGSSQTIVDAIASLEQNDISLITNSTALGEVPLTGPLTEFERILSGTVSTNANSTVITGVGTKFTEELKGSLFGLRSRIEINDQVFFVANIDSDTQLTVSQAPTFTVSDFAARTDFVDDDFARFTSVKRVLE